MYLKQVYFKWKFLQKYRRRWATEFLGERRNSLTRSFMRLLSALDMWGNLWETVFVINCLMFMGNANLPLEPSQLVVVAHSAYRCSGTTARNNKQPYRSGRPRLCIISMSLCSRVGGQNWRSGWQLPGGEGFRFPEAMEGVFSLRSASTLGLGVTPVRVIQFAGVQDSSGVLCASIAAVCASLNCITTVAWVWTSCLCMLFKSARAVFLLAHACLHACSSFLSASVSLACAALQRLSCFLRASISERCLASSGLKSSNTVGLAWCPLLSTVTALNRTSAYIGKNYDILIGYSFAFSHSHEYRMMF